MSSWAMNGYLANERNQRLGPKKSDGIRRLELLANHLCGVKPEYFSLCAWKCGIVACAVGHACQIPEFTEEGFCLVRFDVPSFSNELGWNAVRLFFGLSSEDASALFSSNSYHPNVTPSDVATKIYVYIFSGELL